MPSTPLAAVPAVPDPAPADFEIRLPEDNFIEEPRNNFDPFVPLTPTPAPFVPLDSTPGPFEGTPFGARIPFRPAPIDPLVPVEPALPAVTSPSPFSSFPATPTPAPEAPRSNLASIFSHLQDEQPAQPAPNLGPFDPLAGSRTPTPLPAGVHFVPDSPFGVFRPSFNNEIESDTALLLETPLTPVVDPRFPLNSNVPEVPGLPGVGVPVPAVPRPGAVPAVPGQFDSLFGQKTANPPPITPGAFVPIFNEQGPAKLQTEEFKEPNNVGESSQPLIIDDNTSSVFASTPKTTTPQPFTFEPTSRPTTTRGKLRGGRQQRPRPTPIPKLTSLSTPKSQFDAAELSFSFDFGKDEKDEEDSLAVEQEEKPVAIKKKKGRKVLKKVKKTRLKDGKVISETVGKVPFNETQRTSGTQ